MNFELINTNIINVSADAIVLPANTQLKEGNGASSAIFEAAGRKKLTQACKKIGFCEIGSAVPTLAYDLDAKYIIHAVVPKWIDGNHNEYELLSSAYFSALKVADVMGCESIAFPLLASGNNGYDLDLAFQIAKESIESFSATCLRKAILVLFGKHITNIVKNHAFDVIMIPPDLMKEKQELIHQRKMKKIAEDGKEVAQKILEDGIQLALDYLKDEEHRKEAFFMGKEVVKLALIMIKK